MRQAWANCEAQIYIWIRTRLKGAFFLGRNVSVNGLFAKNSYKLTMLYQMACKMGPN